MEKENSKSLMYIDLMILYPCVASFLDYIGALYIDHDLGCLNMSIIFVNILMGAGHKELHTFRL